MPNPLPPADYIKTVCDELEVSGAQLAKLIGRSQSYVAHITSGRDKSIDPLVQEKIAQLIAVRRAENKLDDEGVQAPEYCGVGTPARANRCSVRYFEHLPYCEICLYNAFVSEISGLLSND